MSYHATSFSGGSTTVMGVPSNSSPNLDGIEMAGRTVEKMLHGDGQFPALQDKLRVGMQLNLKPFHS